MSKSLSSWVCGKMLHTTCKLHWCITHGASWQWVAWFPNWVQVTPVSTRTCGNTRADAWFGRTPEYTWSQSGWNFSFETNLPGTNPDKNGDELGFTLIIIRTCKMKIGWPTLWSGQKCHLLHQAIGSCRIVVITYYGHYIFDVGLVLKHSMDTGQHSGTYNLTCLIP